MSNLKGVTVSQLKRAIEIREQIELLEAEMAQILGDASSAAPASGKRTMSASARAKIGAAQRARWAKSKGTKAEKPVKKRRSMSAAAKAAISAAAKKRWQKAKAAGKNSL